MIEDYYQILGVSRQADSNAIKQAYRRLALSYHPDRHQGSKWHEEHFKKIVAAYQVLSNEQERNWYDLKLAQQEIQATVINTTAVRQQAPNRYTPPRPTAAEKRAEKARQRRYTIYTLIATLVLVTIGITIYFVMGHYSSRYYYKKKNYAAAIFHDENYIEAYISYAKQLYQAGQPEQAIRVVNTGLEKVKGSQQVLQKELYWLQAELYLRLHEYESARNSLEILLQTDAHNEDLRYKLGQLHTFLLQNYEAGIAQFDTLLQKNPNNYDALVGRGYAYYKINEPQKALIDLNYAVHLNSERYAAYYYRAYTNITLSDTLQACEDLKKAHQLGAENAAIHLLEICH
jgi:curved DNA-binding protein CbpA